MKGERWLILVMLIIGSIVGCGESRQSQAIGMSKEMIEAGVSWRWEDIKREFAFREVTAIHAISPKHMWEIDFVELPVPQSRTMETGIEWAAAIEIRHALQVTYHDGVEPVWVDARALCIAKDGNGEMRVGCAYESLY